jgi:sterol desaturase/sphingolipid hydroxylase (fatty acid hydroxylase superfamily)
VRTERPNTPLIAYGFYPTLLAATLAYAVYELQKPSPQFGSDYGYFLGTVVAAMVAVELRYPLRAAWRMTSASFFRRDLPYLVVSGATIVSANYAAGWTLVHFGVARPSALSDLPLPLAVALALVIPDFLWYWVHRLSHEAPGAFGKWMWRVHVAHHLPGQVYLFMHAVAHPINTVIVRALLTVPLFAAGFSVEALFVANLVVGIQGLVSHFNVDVRAGVFNYVLMGAELHRYHHSADPAEAKNYGAVVTLWDQLFGTWRYRPGVTPVRLGIEDPARFPRDRDVVGVLLLPLRHARFDDRRAAVGASSPAP